MYATLNVISDIQPAAEKFIMDNDRLIYRPFFETAEKFLAAGPHGGAISGAVLGGRVGLDLLIGRPLHKDSFVWEIYCDNTWAAAKELADALYLTRSPHIPARTVALQTNIKHREFTIYVETRVIFKFYNMDKYRGVKLIDLMGPASVPSYFLQIPIQCFSTDMQLINVYKILYSPARIAMWQTALDAEAVIRGVAVAKSGGRRSEHLSQAIDLAKIMRKLIHGSDNVLIGDYAVEHYLNERARDSKRLQRDSKRLQRDSKRLQFITSTPIEQIAAAAERVINEDLRRVSARDYKVIFVRFPLNIPSDFQIVKHTLYIVADKEQHSFADVFNSAEFEIIPYVNADAKIGSIWVVLRFLFIDLWILKLISKLDSAPTTYLAAREDALLSTVTKLQAAAQERLSALNAADSGLFPRDYVGRYINDEVAKKKFIREQGERFPTYYPLTGVPGGVR